MYRVATFCFTDIHRRLRNCATIFQALYAVWFTYIIIPVHTLSVNPAELITLSLCNYRQVY